MITRRLFSLGLLAAPAVIRTPGLLMPVKAPSLHYPPGLAWLRSRSSVPITALTIFPLETMRALSVGMRVTGHGLPEMRIVSITPTWVEVAG